MGFFTKANIGMNFIILYNDFCIRLLHTIKYRGIKNTNLKNAL
jgi:hypothetical protein